MKKTPASSLAVMLILFISILSYNRSSGQSAKKTITYDWATKGIVDNKSLPFDEPFTFKIINLDPKIKNLRVLIKEKIKGSNCNNPIDTVCFNNLRTVYEFSFDQNRLQSVLIRENLKPNRDYFIGFKITDKSKLSEAAKKDLNTYLTNNPALDLEINDMLLNKEIASVNIADINRVIYKYIKSYNAKYETDTATILSTKNTDAQYQIWQAYLGLESAGSDLKNLADNLKIRHKFKDAIVAPIKDLVVEKPDDDCCLIKRPFSRKSFFETMEKIKQDIIKKTGMKAAEQAKFKKYYDAQVADLQKEFDNRDKAIISWRNDVLLNVTLEQTYLILNLGTTTIDQESTTTSPYISQSFGYGFSPRTSKGLFYFSYSIFFRPVNLSVPLSDYEGWDYIKTRFCGNLGFTLENVETNKSGKISGLGSLFANKAGIIGIGYRPLPFLKVDFNYMLYYMNDPNPLLNQKRFTASPLIGLSFNLNIIKIFAGQPNTLSSLTDYANK